MRSLLLSLCIMVGLAMYPAGPASAGCTKRAWGTIYIMIEYLHEAGNRPRQVRMRLKDHVSATGHYGGGCRTHVGRGKARYRGKKIIYKAMVADYDNNWFAQASLVCHKVQQRNNTETRLFSNNLARALWIRVLSFDFKVSYGEGRKSSGGDINHPKIRAWPNQRFLCRQTRPYQVND
jgi:hypothetical protein